MLNFLYGLATDRYKGILAFTLKFFLLLLSYVYGLLILALELLCVFTRKRLACKVISVGNITLGGTGKTVIVEHIAFYLKEKGHRIAILSRGYGRKPQAASRKPQVNYEAMGDEPYMLKLALKDIPVIVDANRARGAAKAIKEYGVDTVILDDGFQQWRIKKDLDIVAVDSNFAFGNKKMLPRGLLREPLFSLRRADVFFLTKTNLGIRQDLPGLLTRINKKALIVESVYEAADIYNIRNPQESYNPNLFKDKKIISLCGIADPESFRKLIIGLSFKLDSSFVFKDHHEYTLKDLERVDKQAKASGVNCVLTTQKDAARIQGLNILNSLSVPIYALRIKLEFRENEQGFYNRLLGIYGN